MDSVSKQLFVPPVFFCPFARFKNKEDEFRWIQFDESPTLSDVAAIHESPSSSPFHIRPLDWHNAKEGIDNNLLCFVCRTPIVDAPFYSCKECPDFPPTSYFSKYFHKDCIEPISKHPYHPKHSLRLIRLMFPSKGDSCSCCSKYSYKEYRCSICDFTICENCARKPPLLTIDNHKRHEHTLFYFPRKGSLICDVCALSDHRSMMYSCTQCDYLTHKDCVDMPCLIRISRHEHRLSFNSSLTPEKWCCGVCRGKIDTNYGRYTCVKGCRFGVHSKCATRQDVWDGNELEGEPEDAYEDIKSFSEISDGIIQHFSHQNHIQHFSHQNHHMRLDKETNRAFDENKRCQVCTLPICDDIIYSCMDCDFILHQECAHLPRKKYHGTHSHPLSLQVENDSFGCTACNRGSNGFAYLCYQRYCDFKLDVRCASIAEPLDHRCHPHPLFLTLEPGLWKICSICHTDQCSRLDCGECGFVVCFGCASLPYKLRYKHDEHFLIFSTEENVSGQYLCEVCEKEANPKYGIYMCDECNVLLHVECLLGKDMYMMPRRIVHFRKRNVPILPNNRLTRQICKKCDRRCEEQIVYKISDREICCSFHCLYYYLHPL